VAQQVSLYIRGAQVYTTGSLRTVRTVGSNTSVDIPSYGMHFVNGNNNFLLFGNIPEADGNVVNYNYLEDSACSGSGECVEKYRLPAGYRFSPSGLKTCTSQQGLSCSSVDSVDIVFKRPETQAYFYCGASECVNTKSVMIEISSIKNNLKRWVRISESGQVAVLLADPSK
jgi:hypothetical protein